MLLNTSGALAHPHSCRRPGFLRPAYLDSNCCLCCLQRAMHLSTDLLNLVRNSCVCQKKLQLRESPCAWASWSSQPIGGGQNFDKSGRISDAKIRFAHCMTAMSSPFARMCSEQDGPGRPDRSFNIVRAGGGLPVLVLRGLQAVTEAFFVQASQHTW